MLHEGGLLYYNMEESHYSETLVTLLQATRRRIPLYLYFYYVTIFKSQNSREEKSSD